MRRQRRRRSPKGKKCLSFFHYVQKWSTTIVVGIRLTWVRCFGIRLNVWGEKCFSLVAQICGKYMKIGVETDSLQRMESTHLLIQTPFTKQFDFCQSIKINGTVYQSKVVKETRITKWMQMLYVQRKSIRWWRVYTWE